MGTWTQVQVGNLLRPVLTAPAGLPGAALLCCTCRETGVRHFLASIKPNNAAASTGVVGRRSLPAPEQLLLSDSRLATPAAAIPQIDKGSEAPLGRGGAACVAIGPRRVLLVGGASRDPQPFGDIWLLELGEGGSGTWTRISAVVKLSNK